MQLLPAIGIRFFWAWFSDISTHPSVLSWMYSNSKLLLVRLIMIATMLNTRSTFSVLILLGISGEHSTQLIISCPYKSLFPYLVGHSYLIAAILMNSSHYSSQLVLWHFPTSEHWSASEFSSYLILFLFTYLLDDLIQAYSLNPSIRWQGPTSCPHILHVSGSISDSS